MGTFSEGGWLTFRKSKLNVSHPPGFFVVCFIKRYLPHEDFFSIWNRPLPPWEAT